jgi:hypothetical protein
VSTASITRGLAFMLGSMWVGLDYLLLRA